LLDRGGTYITSHEQSPRWVISLHFLFLRKFSWLLLQDKIGQCMRFFSVWWF